VSSGRCCARPYLFTSDPLSVLLEQGETDPDAALARLDQALDRSREELLRVERDVAATAGAEHAAIFASHRLVLVDEEWLDPIRERIAAGEAAAMAVWRVSEEVAAELRALDDAYLRERGDDIIDVAKRVLGALGCEVRPALPGPEHGEVVLVARELTPSDTVGLDPVLVRGIVTELGARTSHSAILARQLGIPAVVAVPGVIAAARDAQAVALDGDAGACEIDPDAETAAAFRAPAASAVPIVTGPVTTRDGATVAICANASSARDVADAMTLGADGIGLFRTEFLFLGRGEPPDEDAQAAEYAAAAAAAGDRPVVFRTLDVGADKVVPGISLPSEENPFLGVRGIRLSLQEREQFDIQLRALARAYREHPNVRVMVPMVSDAREMVRVRELVDAVPGTGGMLLGAMIEVPSAAILVREMAAHADFFSVGTNDLTGYLLAADRTNMRLGDLYDELHPAVLRVLRMICVGAGEHGTPLSICGEIAGDVRALALLVGLGYRSLSVAAPLVPRVKAAVAELDAGAARELALRALASSEPAEVRAVLAAQPDRSRQETA
jgi:phosphoenolpyruvate-protein phosphotransferase